MKYLQSISAVLISACVFPLISNAQEIGHSLFGADPEDIILGSPPVEDLNKYFGPGPYQIQTKGVDVPDHIVMFNILVSARLPELLESSGDKLVFYAKRSSSLASRKSRFRLIGDSICLRVLDPVYGNDAKSIAAHIVELDNIENNTVINEYNSLLTSLSATGQGIVLRYTDESKQYFSNTEIDWLAWSEMNPEEFLEMWEQSCETRNEL